MGLAEDVEYQSATELARQIREGHLSPVEVIDGCIELIQDRNPRLNAVVYEGFDDARAAAAEAERALVDGEPLGPLHGVPAAIKDLFDFKPGWPATFGGIPALRGHIATGYCTFAKRAEAAGAILVGKTNSPAMGFRGTCDNYLFGPTHNPFDLSLNAGGSSGGSAAAVADGLLPFAEGTDGGGSIRIPAAWCGVYGYKASFGRIPNVARPNAFAATDPFMFKGPLTRTVEDAALVVTALSGYEPADPFALDENPDLRAGLLEPIEGWRIAYSADFDVFPVDPEIKRVIDEAVLLFETAGATVSEVTLGIEEEPDQLIEAWARLILPTNLLAFQGLKEAGIDVLGAHPEDLPPEYLRWIEQAPNITVDQRLADQQRRTRVYDALQDVFGTYDLLVTPSVAAMPVANASDGNTLGPSKIDGVDVDPLIGWAMAYLLNFTGHPAASVPAGLSAGLPVGMQIIGPRYADAAVLRASATIERLRPWTTNYELIRR